jgi:hypothetical protein
VVVEVVELAFLFRVVSGSDWHDFSEETGIDLHSLGVLGGFESVGRGGHGRTERCGGYSKAELP